MRFAAPGVSVAVKVSHTWGEPTYTWAEDGRACTATRVCEKDGSHIETATAAVTGKVTKQATCTEKGETTCTAAFAEARAAVQTKAIYDIPATGSETRPTYPADSADNKADNNKSPQTGDPGNAPLWLALLLVSGGAAAGIAFTGKKKNRHG